LYRVQPDGVWITFWNAQIWNWRVDLPDRLPKQLFVGVRGETSQTTIRRMTRRVGESVDPLEPVAFERTAPGYASPARWSSRIERARSVKRSVTVPSGTSRIPCRSVASERAAGYASDSVFSFVRSWSRLIER
jgi:hypothetical protein